MTSDRRLGLVLLAVGVGVAAWAQSGAALVRRPLYDGVVVTEPYKWLDPPRFNAGGATGVTDSVLVRDGASPVVAVATDELPPQAQMLATPGSLNLHAGATSIEVSIEPVPPPAPPATGFIDGNVYEFVVVDDAGRPITAPAAAEVTVVLRSADPTRTEASIARFDGAQWVTLPTTPSGPGEFFATVTAFGDFAVIVQGDDPYATLQPTAEPTVEPTPTPAAVTTSLPSPNPSATPPASPTATDGVPLIAVVIGGILALLGAGLGVLVWLQRREDRRRGF